jgi:hypothetical protein
MLFPFVDDLRLGFVVLADGRMIEAEAGAVFLVMVWVFDP